MTDETVYEVEEIQSSRVIRGKTQFYIKWRNFPIDDNTWEPEENLDCPDLIATFLSFCLDQRVFFLGLTLLSQIDC